MGPFPQSVAGAKGGRSIELLAGSHAHFKRIGITIDWATVDAAASDLTLADGVEIKAGEKYIRYGQPLVEITSGASIGFYGPFDPGATDGRQTVDATRRSQVVLANATVHQDDEQSDHCPGGAVEGGLVWKERLIATDGVASKVAGPTFANLQAALPLLRFA